MTCIGGTGSNKSYIENFVEVLLALSKKYYDNLVNYMNAFVNESGFPSDKVGSHQSVFWKAIFVLRDCQDVTECPMDEATVARKLGGRRA